MHEFSVLVAEDEPLLLNDVETKINALDSGFRVVARASDGMQALNYLDQHTCDLLVTDIKMPVMDGLELIRKVSQTHPHTKMIVLSGYADFEYAKAAMRYGVSEYLLKPVRTEDLESVLGTLRIQLNKERNVFETEYSVSTANRIVPLVKEYIKTNYAQSIEFASLAEQFGCNAAHLTKMFSKSEGMAPIKYLTDLRLNEAKRLLSTTDLPVKAVGELVGYPDQFYFSKLFKQALGMSPLQYRKAAEGKT